MYIDVESERNIYVIILLPLPLFLHDLIIKRLELLRNRHLKITIIIIIIIIIKYQCDTLVYTKKKTFQVC